MTEDRKRERLRFRSWHRGTREMDLLLGQFADAHMHALSAADLTEYDGILELGDPDLYSWIAGREPVPAQHDTPLMRLICAHHTAAKA